MSQPALIYRSPKDRRLSWTSSARIYFIYSFFIYCWQINIIRCIQLDWEIRWYTLHGESNPGHQSKNGVLKSFAKFTQKYVSQSCFRLWMCNFITNVTNEALAKYFPVNLTKLLKRIILQKNSVCMFEKRSKPFCISFCNCQFSLNYPRPFNYLNCLQF